MKKKSKNIMENNYKIIVFGFFAVFFLAGTNIYMDYGLSWDSNRIDGLFNAEYIITNNPQNLYNSGERYYGAAVPLLLLLLTEPIPINMFFQGNVDVQKILENVHDADTRDIYFKRHLYTFLIFFLSVFFFFLICKDRFNDWKIALIGCSFLILSPIIFAHSFYNARDIPLLSFFIISIYTLFKFYEKKSYSMAIIHGFTSAFLIDIRIVGIILPIITFCLIIIDFVLPVSESKPKINFKVILTFIISLIAFTILLWPFLWPDPLNNFIEAFKRFSIYPWGGSVLYFGNYVKATELPWHYLPVWISITTPLLYLILFVIGILILSKSFFSNPIRFYLEQKKDFIFLLCLIVPVVTVIVMKSVLYDGWRHMFFIYPMILYISLHGLKNIYNEIAKLHGLKLRIGKFAFIFIIIVSLGSTLLTMIEYHPFQNVYFNFLAGKNMEEIKNNFEMDYWGLSYRKGLEYILENDKSQIVLLNVANFPGKKNAEILTFDQRARISYTDKLNEADYFLSNYRLHKEEYPYNNEFYNIKIKDAKILVVYKLK